MSLPVFIACVSYGGVVLDMSRALLERQPYSVQLSLFGVYCIANVITIVRLLFFVICVSPHGIDRMYAAEKVTLVFIVLSFVDN